MKGTISSEPERWSIGQKRNVTGTTLAVNKLASPLDLRIAFIGSSTLGNYAKQFASKIVREVKKQNVIR